MITFLFLYIFALGLIMGSFVNAALYRVRKKLPLGGRARSICPHCKHTLIAADLIPLFSYLALHGRCRYCGRPIDKSYPLIELATGLTFVAVLVSLAPLGPRSLLALAVTPLVILNFVFALAVATYFVFICVYDLRYKLILTRVLAPLAALTLVYHLAHIALTGDLSFLTTALTAGIISFSFFYLLYFFSKGKWMGGGDVRLAGLLGLILGAQMFLGFFLAFMTGAIVGIVMLANHAFKTKRHEIPFGPFLVLGALVALLFGNAITAAFYRLVLIWF